MEILDLVARIGWDANLKDLQQIQALFKAEDKALEELRMKGARLEQQMLKTNDPKKVAAFNRELQATKKAADQITEAQKKQADISKQLVEQQKKLHTELQKNNKPEVVKGLLQNLYKVENQIDAVSGKAQTMGNKLGGLGQSIMQGIGIGAGAFGVEAVVGGITSFLSDSIDEILQAEKSARDLKLALEAIGAQKFFPGLIEEATKLSEQFNNLFDNDEIIAAQTEFVKYGKVSRNEIEKLTEVSIELASKLGIDVVSASNKVIDILAGRGASTLRDFGLSTKNAKTETELMNLVLVDLAEKVEGASDAYAKSAEGIKKQNELIIANTKEQIGEKLLPIYISALQGINDLLSGEFDKMGVVMLKGSEKILSNLFPVVNAIKDLYGSIFPSEKTASGAGVVADLKAFYNEQLKLKKQAEADANKKLSAGDDEVEKVKVAKKKIEKETKKDPIKIKADINVGGVSLTEKPEKVAHEIARAVTKIENSAEFKRAESQREVDRQNKKEQEEAAAEELARNQRIALYNETINVANAANDQLRIEENKTNRLIALQEKRVEAARNDSQASLKIEQDRLNELLKKRQQYERAQRVIDAAVITANQALAISGAIATIANSKNPVLIAANVLAILAGIGAVIGSIRSINADEGFKEGGFTGEGNPNETSTAIGKRPYKYHKKEFVMDEGLTSKHRDLFEGLHKRDLVVKKLDDGKYYITRDGLDTDSLVNDHTSLRDSASMMPLLAEMQGIRSLLKQREVRVENNFDSEGFGMSVASQLGNITLKTKMREW